ncbi:MAG: helix-turn-helix transcriptional regulator [Treponema sp.]|nr:helix-turn-helix transcriptional regulator [Spirochaetia bacterium]MDD7459059.1 helix-turn-helix transcriptional regulator [Spirochaetales bacterium]MDY5811804.1 helix-turn-helix transcriptional regulator [Treponema sp.]MEE1182629.1 helix-turn-helix transcriptional regulator [Treponema sp.]
MKAYSELYLDDVKELLSEFFDYLINDCKFDAAFVSDMFVNTGLSAQVEIGNPAYISGMSGIELAALTVKLTFAQMPQLPEVKTKDYRSAEYWAGWALAQYQWQNARRFKDIFERVPFNEIIGMYPVYHEEDITDFISAMDERYTSAFKETRLKRLREASGMSQSQLAELSEVNIRTIRSYEQKTNDINKAQVNVVRKLAHALGCDIADLME